MGREVPASASGGEGRPGAGSLQRPMVLACVKWPSQKVTSRRLKQDLHVQKGHFQYLVCSSFLLLSSCRWALRPPIESCPWVSGGLPLSELEFAA